MRENKCFKVRSSKLQPKNENVADNNEVVNKGKGGSLICVMQGDHMFFLSICSRIRNVKGVKGRFLTCSSEYQA